MKFSTAFLLAASATMASAFAPPSRAFVSRGQALFMSEAEAAIKAAKEATEKFGASSPEAASAWDLVEEIDASTSHHKKTAVAEAVKETPAAEEAKEFEISSYSEALEEAKRVTEEKGIQSSEARLAWELVEELGATKSHHETSGSG